MIKGFFSRLVFVVKLKQMRQVIFFGILLILPAIIHSQSTGDFKKAMNDGDSRAVSSFVHSFVDLQIEQNRQRANRTQAERMLRDFFESKREIRFLFRHQSGQNSGNGSQFKIGRLDADNQRYRVFVLFGNINGKTEITELSIERD
jgi:hypothetical protein